MRFLILVSALSLPLAAQAQQTPPTFAVPAGVFQHIINYTSIGGSHAEGQALAEQLIALAQQQMAAQKAPEAPAR
jgi:hypothetical protein